MKLPCATIGLIAVLLAPGPLPAQDPGGIEARLQALERQVQGLVKENAELKKQLGWKEGATPVVVQPGGKETRLTLGGFLQAQAEFGHAADSRWSGVRDRFFFRRARIYVAGSFAEDFDFKAELDLQGNTLGAATGHLARANEIFLNWHKYAAANVRFGQLKPAFGAEALMSDTKMLTIERALASDRLTDGRNLSVGLAGEFLDRKVGYYATLGNGNGANVSANDNDQFQKSARLVVTPRATARDKLVLGVDALGTTDVGLARSDLGLPGNLFTGSRHMVGFDAQWIHGPFELEGEWLRGSFRPAGGAKFDAEGWQVTAGWFLWPAKLQAVFREEQFDPNTAIGGNTVSTHTFGLNYYLKGDDIKFMLDYLDGRVPGSVQDGGRLLSRVQIIF